MENYNPTKFGPLKSMELPTYIHCATLGRNSARVLATGGLDNAVNLWAIGNTNSLQKFTECTSPVQSVVFSDDEKSLAAGTISGSIKVWELEEAKEVRSLVGHKASTDVVKFHPFGMYLVSGSKDCNVKLWDCRKKTCAFTYKGHEDSITCFDFTPDGKWVASGSQDKTIKIWDLTAGKMIHEYTSHNDVITDIHFNPKVVVMTSASRDRNINFYEMSDFSLYKSTRQKLANPVNKLCFHPDDEILYAASGDYLKIYDFELNLLESIKIGWGDSFHDMAISRQYHQLIGVSCEKPYINPYVVNIKQCAPYVKIDSDQNNPEKPFKGHQSQNYESSGDKIQLRTKPNSKDAAGIAPSEDKPSIVQLNKNYRESILSNNEKPLTPDNPPRHMVSNYKPPNPIQPNNVEPIPDIEPLETKLSDDNYVDSIVKIHKSVNDNLKRRYAHLNDLKRVWNPRNISEALRRANEVGDPCVIIDLLSLFLEKNYEFELKVAEQLLPSIRYFVNSSHKRHVEIIFKILKIILTSFSDLIVGNIRNPPHSVDIHQEERYRRSKTCYDYLCTIKEELCKRQDLDYLGQLQREVFLLFELLKTK